MPAGIALGPILHLSPGDVNVDQVNVTTLVR
jgi:hypothetical protein